MGLSLRNIRKKIVDVFDANTQADQQKRLAAGQPRMYQQQHPNAPKVAPPPMIARPVQPVGSGRDARGLASKLYDQVNFFDNGRTFKNDTPVNIRSNLAQATHNGLTNAVGGIVKPIAINPVQTAAELTRFGAATITKNKKAQEVSTERLQRDVDESLLGYGKTVVSGVGSGIGNFTAAAYADLTGDEELGTMLRDEGIRQFNRTPFGQVSNMGQKAVVNFGTKKDNKKLSKDEQNKLVDENLQGIGIDPKASLGKQVTDTASSALQLYGMAEGIKQGGQKINAFKEGKTPLSSTDIAIRERLNNRPSNLKTIEQSAKNMSDAERLKLANGDTGQAGLMSAEPGTRRLNPATGKVETIPPGEAGLPKVSAKGATPQPGELPGTKTGTIPPSEQPISSTKTTPKTILDRMVDAKEYVKQQNELQKQAAKSTEKTGVGKVVQNIKIKAVDNLAPLETPLNKALGFGAEKTTQVREAINRSLTAQKIAGAFAEDKGLNAVIKAVGGKKNRAEFDQYVIAKHAQDLEANGIKTGRDLAADANLIEAFKSKYEGHSQALTKYNHALLDEATNSGLISPETNAFLKQKYPNYVPFDRIFTKEEMANMSDRRGNGGPASISSHELEKRLKGSDRQIASPLESTAIKTNEIIRQSEKNKAARAVVDAHTATGQPIKAVRTAENVMARREAYQKLAELKPQRDALQKEVKSMSKAFRDLEKRNKVLGPQVLDKIMGDGKVIRDNAMREANGKLQGSGSKLAKLPDEAQINEAFQQYLDGNPKLVQNMFEFQGNKAEQTRLMNTLDGVKNQLDATMNERKQAFNEARLHADAVKRGNDTMSVYKNGIKEIYEVPHEVAKAAKNLNPVQQGLWGKVFSYPTRVLRLGATGINPAFALANVVKDVGSGFINSEHSFEALRNPKVFLQAIDAAVHHGGENFKELRATGAAGTSFDIGRDSAKVTVKKIASERNVGTKILYTATHPADLLRAAEDLVGRSEEAGRAYQYFSNKSAALKANKSMEFAKTYGADAARNNTVNFARMGEYGHVLNTAIPYLNAGVQGSRTLVRNLKERPVSTIAKTAAIGFMPVATSTAWNLSDPERKKAYDDIRKNSPWEFENNIIFIPPHPKQDDAGNWGVIKIPVSQEIANLNNVVRNGVEARMNDASFDSKKLVSDLIGTGTSVQTDSVRKFGNQFTPQIAKPVVEATTNTNLFTGQKIVPDAIKNLDPKDQYNKNTSGTAKVIGKATGTSPLQIDNAIRTATGGLGQNIINTTDKGLAKVGLIKKDEVRGKSIPTAIASRFNGAKGSTDGGKFFKAVENQTKNHKLAGRDYEALQAILAKEVDGDGKPVKQNEKDVLFKNRTLASNPKVAAVLADTAKDVAKETGKKIDPIYNLTPEQQNTYYQMQSSSYNGQDYNRFKEKNKSWMKGFQEERAKYYQDLNLPPPDDAKVKYPLDKSQQKTINDYFAVADPAKRGQLIKSNPQISKALSSLAKYGNDRRVAQGFDPLDTYPETPPIVQKWTDEYFAQPKGTKMRWQRNNPEKWQAVSQDMASKEVYTMQEEASKSQFKDTGMSQKQLKAIDNLGEYNISKNTDANGNTFYALGSTGDSSGGGGYGGYGGRSGGGGGGSEKGVNPYKYAVSLKSGKVSLKGRANVSSKTKAKGKKFAVAKPKVTSKKSRV